MSPHRRAAGSGVGRVPPPDAVLARAATLLGCFDEGAPVLSLARLAERSGLPKGTVHRLAGQLVEHGLLDRDERGYRLGIWLFELGELVPQHRTLSDAARPIMTDLYEATRQRIHLAVLSGIDVVYVEIVGGSGMRIGSRTGGRLPAHATGVGKAMLAYSPAAVVRARVEAGLGRLTPRTITTPGGLDSELRKIRSVGMSLDLEESTLGLSCVAAPVFGSDRKVHAALSITGSTARFDPGTLGPAVRTAAYTLSRVLRTSGL
ncbi:MAG TPA: IclR family transcriptional regulator [Phycicoccus sp.]|nr:IclR family transcriptional regulator [Phycicoccus sp.]HRA44736.1 IclR family transcriptional regulator [Phycicoccus sp.]